MHSSVGNTFSQSVSINKYISLRLIKTKLMVNQQWIVIVGKANVSIKPIMKIYHVL